MPRLNLLLLPLLALTPSCIGGWIYTTNHARLVAPTIDPALPHVIKSTTSAPELTTDSLTEIWGKPNEIVALSATEKQWIYLCDGRIWHGVLGMLVILPLPLIIPAERERVILVVRDKVVVEADVYLEEERGRAFGWVPGPGIPPLRFGTARSSNPNLEGSARHVETHWYRTIPKVQ